MSSGRPVLDLLDRFQPQGEAETADVARMRELLSGTADPWLRSNPLHVTASAVIVHPETGRVLLRWHQRQQAWLQVGGHGDPGESDPMAVALREAREESGLTDLGPWPDAELWQVAIVSVPASSKEPAHEHADVRFIFATHTSGGSPGRVTRRAAALAPGARGGRRHLRGQPARDAAPRAAPARLSASRLIAARLTPHG